MAAKIAVWSAAEAYKPIRRGIKQSESRRIMPSLLLIFPNICSDNCVRIRSKQLRWNRCNIFEAKTDVSLKLLEAARKRLFKLCLL